MKASNNKNTAPKYMSLVSYPYASKQCVYNQAVRSIWLPPLTLLFGRDSVTTGVVTSDIALQLIGRNGIWMVRNLVLPIAAL